MIRYGFAALFARYRNHWQIVSQEQLAEKVCFLRGVHLGETLVMNALFSNGMRNMLGEQHLVRAWYV